MSTETVTVEQFINAPRDRVWIAITSPETLGNWWGPGDISAEVGHRFTMDMNKWGKVPCLVLESVPHERLVYTFGDRTLTWTLTQKINGTLLRLDHSGFDLSRDQDKFAFDNMGSGWKTVVLPRLAQLVEAETV